MFALRKNNLYLGLGLVFLLLILLTACGKDLEVGGPPPPDPYPVATTPTILMENFVRAYSKRDLKAYTELLHDDFIFSFQPCDVARLGLSKDHYTLEDELQTAANMFKGKDHVKNNGQVVPGITDIVFQLCEQEQPWAPAGEAAIVPDARRASYQVEVRFQRTDGSSLRVRGRSVFFAAPVARAAEIGAGGREWQLVGWVDLTEGCGP